MPRNTRARRATVEATDEGQYIEEVSIKNRSKLVNIKFKGVTINGEEVDRRGAPVTVHYEHGVATIQFPEHVTYTKDELEQIVKSFDKIVA